MLNYNTFFPYAKTRPEQRKAIEFAIKAIKDSEKRFVIIEAGTGVGKSAVGLTLCRYLHHQIISVSFIVEMTVVLLNKC